ncbi:hypothetical protein E7V67_022045 [[Empedobacter] haloabium]|uniref:Uncharacterized protein n=1 Tax=[Empedobacter] haloabium TaxID=592317 RepID=A0ABZ1UHY7_9BURK
MPELAGWVAVLGGVTGVFALVKIVMEISALPWTLQRSRYEFAHAFAEKANDPVVASYAVELGYMMLVNDARLSTRQRAAVLTLPNRARNIQRYRKAKSLLDVHVTGPVLSWKYTRHGRRWYRNGLMVSFWLIYVVSAGIGSIVLLSPYVVFQSEQFQQLTMPLYPGPAVAFLVLGGWLLYHSTKISLAEELIRLANSCGPQRD